MNILYVSKTSLAGVCELMAGVINKYTEHEARVLNRGPGKHSWYLREKGLIKTYILKYKKDIDVALDWAEVVHCMANVGVENLFCRHLLNKKIWVFQWHGAQIWPFYQVWRSGDYSKVKWIHIGQGWIETQMDFFAPFISRYGLRIVPNLITIDDELHTPLPWAERLPRSIAFSPSTRKRHVVNKKGVKVVEVACRGFDFELIYGWPFEKCLQMKRIAQLGIDEVVTPMYHRSGLEFLSQGVPCICSYSEATAAALRDVTGCDRIPFIQATKHNLRDVIKAYFAKSDAEREAMSIEARRWMERYYHPKKLIEQYLEVYRS